MKKVPVVAVLGATGNVGRVMLDVLERRDFPVERLVPLASSRTAGTTVLFRGRRHRVVEATPAAFEGVDLVLASAGATVSRALAPAAVAAGAVVVDNSSAFRMDADKPLVVPEVNADALATHGGIIANPNCSTAQLVVALGPIHRASRIRRLVISTYQSVSGTGKAAMDECLEQSMARLDGDDAGDLQPRVYPHPIAFNVIPQCDVFLENGYTKEEMKLVNETRKILGDATIGVTATAVRVPVMRGHSETVNVETSERLGAARVRELLRGAPGLVVVDEPGESVYPMPLYAEGRDATFVGRIRDDVSNPNAIDMFVVADNLLKGAALNAIQIAEELMRRDLLRVPEAARTAALAGAGA